MGTGSRTCHRSGLHRGVGWLWCNALRCAATMSGDIVAHREGGPRRLILWGLAVYLPGAEVQFGSMP